MSLQEFLQKNLIAELGLNELPPEKQEEMLLRIGELVQQNMILRVLHEMNESDKIEFEQIMAQADDEKILQLLESKFSNFNDLIAEEIAKFKEAALAHLEALVQ